MSPKINYTSFREGYFHILYQPNNPYPKKSFSEMKGNIRDKEFLSFIEIDDSIICHEQSLHQTFHQFFMLSKVHHYLAQRNR